MSAAKHTPGPWIVAIDDYGLVIRGAEVEREEHGTKFSFRDYVGSTWGHRSEVSDANARLIAAAPELLEALDEMLTDIGRANSMPSAVKARAVIAKATGSAA